MDTNFIFHITYQNFIFHRILRFRTCVPFQVRQNFLSFSNSLQIICQFSNWTMTQLLSLWGFVYMLDPASWDYLLTKLSSSPYFSHFRFWKIWSNLDSRWDICEKILKIVSIHISIYQIDFRFTSKVNFEQKTHISAVKFQ